MTEAKPIEILDDSDIKEQNQKILEEAIKERTIQKALMGSRFDVMMALAKIQEIGSDEERQKKIKNRIVKFFSYNLKFDIETGYFVKKRDPDYSEEGTHPIDTEIILFGVDFLKTGNIRKRFSDQNPDVKWIDDSHVKIVFEDAGSAKKGIENNLRDKDQWKIKIQEQMSEEIVPKGWFELDPYYEMNLERKLYARYATNNQKVVQRGGDNFYQNYDRAKLKFQSDFLAELGKKQQYEELLNQRTIRGNNRPRNRSRSREKKHNRYNDGNFRDRSFNENNQRMPRDAFHKRKIPRQRQAEGRFIDKEVINENDLSYNYDQKSMRSLGISYAIEQLNGMNLGDNVSEDLSFELDNRENFQSKKGPSIPLFPEENLDSNEMNLGQNDPEGNILPQNLDEDDLSMEAEPKSSSRGFKGGFNYREYLEKAEENSRKEKEKKKIVVLDLSLDG